MTSRSPTLALLAVIGLALSGCSAADGADRAAPDTGGTIELAVSQTCADTADPQCVLVDGQSVVLPTGFEKAAVLQATVSDGDGQHAVAVTFDDDGATVLRALTEKAAGGGTEARLLIRIAGEIESAVVVMEALEGDEVQISLSPDDNAQDLVDRIRAA
jgi:preprotein translocase subunit SecD